MTQGAEANTDESFALDLLEGHLTSRGASEFQCDKNLNDPPDLVVTWESGERWGVEVTRAYQQVEQIGKANAVSSVSSQQESAFLRAFAEKLGEEVEDIRERDYILYLEGLGPFNRWKRPVSRKRWKKETRESILRHVASRESGNLEFPGGILRPGGPGKRWTIMVGGAVAELNSAVAAMLGRALEDKTKDLSKWNGSFAQRWLLLLNCYPLADDSAEVEGTLRQLVRENAGVAGFDGIFWSGYPDRALIPIVLSQKL